MAESFGGGATSIREKQGEGGRKEGERVKEKRKEKFQAHPTQSRCLVHYSHALRIVQEESIPIGLALPLQDELQAQ